MPAPVTPSLRGALLPHRRALAAVAIAAALLLAIHYKAAITVYPHDAALYWAMATSTLPAEYTIRGYLFPAILGSFVSMGAAIGLSPIDAFRVFSSVAYAAVLTLLVPATFSRLAGAPLSLARRLAPLVLVAAVYPGLLLYPLSDLAAVALLWLAAHSMLACRDEADRPRRAIALAVLAGAAAGAAYNTRTVYLFAVLFGAVAVLLQFRGRRRHVLYAALGFALVCLPQVIINKQVHGVASANPAVAFGKTPVTATGRSLFVHQLHSGIPVQKYETSIARDAASPAVYYLDPAGMALLARLCSTQGPIDSMAGYLRAVLAHPIDFIGLYARHFINGLDVRDGRAYTTRASATKTLESLGCITLLMVLVLAISAALRSRTDRRGQPWDWMWPAALVLPALTIIPGAMETRFMLPLMLCLFAAASALWSGPAIASELRPRRHFYFSLALVVYAAFFAVTTSTMANLAPTGIPAQALSCPAK